MQSACSGLRPCRAGLEGGREGGERHRLDLDLCRPSNMRVSPGLGCIRFPTTSSAGMWSEVSSPVPLPQTCF